MVTSELISRSSPLCRLHRAAAVSTRRTLPELVTLTPTPQPPAPPPQLLPASSPPGKPSRSARRLHTSHAWPLSSPRDSRPLRRIAVALHLALSSPPRLGSPTDFTRRPALTQVSSYLTHSRPASSAPNSRHSSAAFPLRRDTSPAWPRHPFTLPGTSPPSLCISTALCFHSGYLVLAAQHTGPLASSPASCRCDLRHTMP